MSTALKLTFCNAVGYRLSGIANKVDIAGDSVTTTGSSLSEQECALLDTAGFVVLKDVLKAESVEKIQERIAEIRTLEGFSAANVVRSETEISLRQGRGSRNILKFAVYNQLSFLARAYARLLFSMVPQMKEAIINYYTSAQPGLMALRKQGIVAEAFHMIATSAQIEDENVGRVCDLVNRGGVFDVLYTHPKILDAVRHIIGEEFKLSSLNFRSPEPGTGGQPLHVDWADSVDAPNFYACNILWVLQDMTIENGGTRVVPGSHKWGRLPNTEMENLRTEHPKQEIVTARAGSAIIVNSHTWHSGTVNRGVSARPIVQAYFVHRAHPAQHLQREFLTPDTHSRLSNETLNILDIPRSKWHAEDP